MLRIEGKLVREGVGMFDMMPGIGAHEVIVETPEHDLELADLPEAHIAELISVYRDRMTDLGGDDRFKYVLIFENQGSRQGPPWITRIHSSSPRRLPRKGSRRSWSVRSVITSSSGAACSATSSGRKHD